MKGLDLAFQVAGQIVLFQQDAVLERLMPALDLPLGPRVIRCAPNMLHALSVEPFCQIGRNVRRSVVRQQSRPMDGRRPIEPGCRRRQVERRDDVVRLHRRAELPGDDVPREVVEDRRVVEPAPAGDLEVSEVGLPELVGRRGLVFELLGSLHDDESRGGDEIVSLQEPIDRSL